jgi:hypothetical protein
MVLQALAGKYLGQWDQIDAEQAKQARSNNQPET